MNLHNALLAVFVAVLSSVSGFLVLGDTRSSGAEPANGVADKSPPPKAEPTAEEVRQSREAAAKVDYQKRAELMAKMMSVNFSNEKTRNDPRYVVEVAVKTKEGKVRSVDKFTTTEGYWAIIEIGDIKKYRLLISATDSKSKNINEIVAVFLPEYFYDENGHYHAASNPQGITCKRSEPVKIESYISDELHYEITAKAAQPAK
jgi:hypothetical protein